MSDVINLGHEDRSSVDSNFHFISIHSSPGIVEASLGLQSGARAKKERERSRSSYFKK